jgi:ribosomal protein L40E
VSGAGTVACLSCGAANDRDAIFCKKCGTKMREGEAMV